MSRDTLSLGPLVFVRVSDRNLCHYTETCVGEEDIACSGTPPMSPSPSASPAAVGTLTRKLMWTLLRALSLEIYVEPAYAVLSFSMWLFSSCAIRLVVIPVIIKAGMQKMGYDNFS